MDYSHLTICGSDEAEVVDEIAVVVPANGGGGGGGPLPDPSGYAFSVNLGGDFMDLNGVVRPKLVKVNLLAHSFWIGLSGQQQSWAVGHQDIYNDLVTFYLSHYSGENGIYINQLLDDIIENSSTEDNLPIDTLILGNPEGNTITDIDLYLECLNANQSAVFTIYVEQPIPNQNNSHDGTEVGHTFISIKQGNIRRVLGFYPVNAISPANPSDPGKLVDNSGHGFDVALSKNISAAQLSNIIIFIKDNNSNYHLNNFNCTDFAMGASKLAGMPLPSAYGTWPLGGGDNPGQLGQNIRNIPAQTGVLKTTAAGDAPESMGSCN